MMIITGERMAHRHTAKRYAGLIATHLVLILFSIVFILPFFWMLSGALKTSQQVFSFPIQWLPNPVVWTDNFVKGWTSRPFNRYLLNTLFITLVGVVSRPLASSLVGYGFARCHFPGRDFLFVIVLATMMLPMQVTMIPLFVIYKNIGWINTYYPLTVPFVLGGGPFMIFLMRQFFLGIPGELEDAARVDGCNSLQIYYRIFLPLAKPALSTVAILSFMYHWNDFLWPLIYINDEKKKTLVLGLESMKDMYAGSWNQIIAVAVLILLPCMMIFFLFQKYFVQGISTTGLKG
jgi:multiple sugar transport system permease protein